MSLASVMSLTTIFGWGKDHDYIVLKSQILVVLFANLFQMISFVMSPFR